MIFSLYKFLIYLIFLELFICWKSLIEGFDTFGAADAVPKMPLALTYRNSSIDVLALLDTGASVNVLPYNVGVQLGAVWEDQTMAVTLAGNLASIEARGLLVSAQIGDLDPVRLVFAWSRFSEERLRQRIMSHYF